jgi:hypothetical protein
MSAVLALSHIDIGIGDIRVRLNCADSVFLDSLGSRFDGFLAPTGPIDYEFDMSLGAPVGGFPEDGVRVFRRDNVWCLRRGDFHAELDPVARRGWIRQTASPYSLDSVLRILHTLVLAREGGMLMHASSVIRNGQAHIFTGVSGVGKTTISRLAPPDAHLLTDEMSFIRREGGVYFAHGTPFAGELARPGENLRAPLDAIYLLVQGHENRIDEVGPADAVRGLLSNILFFAQDTELVQAMFASAIELAGRVPVRRLTFLPDARVWDLIGTNVK